jgi:hypothetical protein
VDLVAVRFDEMADAARRLCRRGGDGDHALEEEPQPVLPRAVGAHPLEVVAVSVAVLLEVKAEVEQRLL